MRVSVTNCGAGVTPDISDNEIGMGIWSNSQNMRFANGYAKTFRGSVQIYATPTFTPYFITPYAVKDNRYWVHAGLTAVAVDDGTTRTDITGAITLTGAIDDRWTGGSSNGVLVLNNGKDDPMYWGGTGTLTALPGWDTTWVAGALRPFKNFLIAVNITKGASDYPHMVKWSDISVPGSIPSSWDETDPAADAGEIDLAETPDELVDCMPMGDVNIIYKERSMYAMTYVGAPYIFSFRRLPGEYGMLARGCVANTPLGHVVMSAGDIVLHNGQQPVSISNAVIRDYIFGNLATDTYKRSFLTVNPQKNEVWVCFPFGESPTCNAACVWNWVDKSWSIRTLDNVTYGEFGQINPLTFSATWDSDPDVWAVDGTTWNQSDYSPAESRLLFCHSTPRLSLADVGTSDFGTAIPAFAERTGMHFDDPTTIKTVRSIYPRIDGSNGAVVGIEVGYAMSPDAAPIWKPSVNFTIGQSVKIDSTATGRYIAVRFTSADYAPWRMRSFDVDYVPAGYW